MKLLSISVIVFCMVSCSKYNRYRGPGLRHDVGTSKESGIFIYTPPDSTLKK